MPRRRRNPPETGGSPGGGGGSSEIGEVRAHRWHRHAETMVGASFWSIARALPSLMFAALRLGWQASRADTITVVAATAVAGLFTAFTLVQTQEILSALLKEGPTADRVEAAIPAMLVIGAALMARSACSALAGWCQSRLKPQVERVAERRLSQLCAQIELRSYDDPDFHDALLRARDRGTMAVRWLIDGSIECITAFTGVIAAAGALGVLHPLLMPLLLISVTPEAWASIRAARMRYVTEFALSASRRRKWILGDLMAEREVAGDLRAYILDDFLLGEWDRVADVEQEAQLQLARRETWARVAGDALGGAATAAVYGTLGLLLATGQLPLAAAGAAVMAIRSLRSSLSNLTFSVNRVYEEGLYFADHRDFVKQAASHLPVRGATPLPDTFTELRAENVSFAYPGADRDALSEVNIRIGRGEVVALVGENGSGKTTLAKLIGGVYQPGSGQIWWDSIPVTGTDHRQWCARIAVIAQDFARWPLTARTNITLTRTLQEGDPPEVVERIEEACTSSGAGEVIAGLPSGLGTLLDRRFQDGVELSGGQWQRIGSARGIYKGLAGTVPLLIADEPTAALDARAEHKLFESIRAHAHGRAVLLITHRLASVQHADRIYVLEHGRVTAEGSHEELMEAGGLYRDLYTLQASAYVPVPRSEAGAMSGNGETPAGTMRSENPQ